MRDNYTDDTIIRDASKERELEELTYNKKNQHYICVPWQLNSDITGRGGAWAFWSGIWLSHLLKKAIESLPMKHIGIDEIDKDLKILKSWKVKANFIGKLKKRGKFDNRRNDFGWKDRALSKENPEGNSGDIQANS